jgi:hypothetical protein
MIRNWRLVAIAAGGAFVLSVLTALIAGVGVGALIFRALIGAVAFGALAAGIQVVVDRFLPELAESSTADAGRSRADETPVEGAADGADWTPPPGGNVDIVVEEEADELGPDSLEREESESSDETGSGEGSASTRERIQPEDADAADVEPEEPEPAEAEPVSDMEPVEQNSAGSAGDELIEEVEEVSSAQSASEGPVETPPQERAGESVRSEDIDSLPDIGGLGDGFENGAGAGDGAAGTSSGEGAEGTAFGETRSSSSPGRSDQDPETIARAIQTVLERDQ